MSTKITVVRIIRFFVLFVDFLTDVTQRWLLSRYFAPSIAAFGEKGLLRERQGCRSFSQGQGWSFENPRQKREAQDKSAG